MLSSPHIKWSLKYDIYNSVKLGVFRVCLKDKKIFFIVFPKISPKNIKKDKLIKELFFLFIYFRQLVGGNLAWRASSFLPPRGLALKD